MACFFVDEYMNHDQILKLKSFTEFEEILKKQDEFYQERLRMLSLVKDIFVKNSTLSELSLEERCLILGQTSSKNSNYDFDPNLFGAPGGLGKVKSILASKYKYLDKFYSTIPRQGTISKEQYLELYDLFVQGVKEAGCDKIPFVLFTRILTVTRPDTFVSAAAKALAPICKVLKIANIGTNHLSYWNELLTKLHQLELFKEFVGKTTNPSLALLDGLAWQSDNNKTRQSFTDVEISPLNQILYGPPGTGKTYHTIEAAVQAAEPDYFAELKETFLDNHELRVAIKEKYDALVGEQRIRFVTFHQSYGYEEFVEGLSTEVAEDKSVFYKIKKGVFKSICEDAAISELDTNKKINSNGRVWKLSIEGAHQNATKKYCLEHNMGAIGWGDTGDLNLEERNEYFSALGPKDQNSLNNFTNEMTIGDLVLCIDSKRTVEAIGVVSGEYIYDEAGLPIRDDYCHHLSINWLVTDESIDFMTLNDDKQFSLQTCYLLFRMNVADVLNYLQTKDIVLIDKENRRETRQNYVLIIDEINRGNISKIFGELITLIEPSKREGQSESLQLTLPYSGKPFSVPDNLYIIGTMNTADRSLAMMDTALRRRFDFKEMMPNASVLAGCKVNGINLEALLATLNARIEILYGREHTLGHAFFIPVKNLIDNGDQEGALMELVSVFQNKILPLLQEYFFDDWHKIRLVLGDNQRASNQQLIEEILLTGSQLTHLFGDEHHLDPYGEGIKQYKLKPFADDVWQDPNVYRLMYDHRQQKTGSVGNAQDNTAQANP
jgi:5-methylcytosine-specific restriction enzyme B